MIPERRHLPLGVSARQRRMHLSVAILLVIAAGLVAASMRSTWAGILSDMLYTVVIYLVLSLLLPHLHAVIHGGIAFIVSASVELLQITGLPALWAETAPPVRYILGLSFDAHDLLWYAIGAATSVLVDLMVSRSQRLPPVEREELLPGSPSRVRPQP